MVLNKLLFGDFNSADSASQVWPTFVRIKMLLLISDLIEALLAAFNRACERLLPRVYPEMIK
jgi:hypothetical protein